MGALAVLLLSAACDEYIRSPDPLDGHPDAVTVAVVLVAGESEARLLATHPHRPSSADPPSISAHLAGPGWTAEFSKTVETEACLANPSIWPGSSTCRRAALPEPIRPGAGYGIGGTAPLGSFSGAVVVPGAPLLFAPVDSLILAAPPGGNRDVKIPILFSAGPDVGTLVATVFDAFQTESDGSEEERSFFPLDLRGDGRDTLSVFYRDKPLRFSLRLVGLGWNYTNFLAHAGKFPLPSPWPNFGIEGEGVYGYFAAAAPSEVARVFVR